MDINNNELKTHTHYQEITFGVISSLIDIASKEGKSRISLEESKYLMGEKMKRYIESKGFSVWYSVGTCIRKINISW